MFRAKFEWLLVHFLSLLFAWSVWGKYVHESELFQAVSLVDINSDFFLAFDVVGATTPDEPVIICVFEGGREVPPVSNTADVGIDHKEVRERLIISGFCVKFEIQNFTSIALRWDQIEQVKTVRIIISGNLVDTHQLNGLLLNKEFEITSIQCEVIVHFISTYQDLPIVLCVSSSCVNPKVGSDIISFESVSWHYVLVEILRYSFLLNRVRIVYHREGFRPSHSHHFTRNKYRVSCCHS